MRLCHGRVPDSIRDNVSSLRNTKVQNNVNFSDAQTQGDRDERARI